MLKVNTNSLIYLRKLKFVLGELLTISATHESELYWVLRGGGGSFVIVTEFKIRLVKSPSLVMSFSFIWYPNVTKLVLQQYQSLLFNDKKMNLSNKYIFITILNPVHTEIVMICFDTELDEFRQTISLLLSKLPIPNRTNRNIEDWLTFVYKHS